MVIPETLNASRAYWEAYLKGCVVDANLSRWIPSTQIPNLISYFILASFKLNSFPQFNLKKSVKSRHNIQIDS